MSSALIGQLPLELFSSKDIFQSVLREGWTILSEDKKKAIMDSCLPDIKPKEGDNDTRAHSKEDFQKDCVQLFLSGDTTRFGGDPLTDHFFQMRVTRLAPDVSKMLDDVRKLKGDAYRIQEKEHQLFLWKEVLSKRRQLMISSLSCGPDDIIHVTPSKSTWNSPSRNGNGLSVQHEIRKKACLRYKRDIDEINTLVCKTTQSQPLLSSDDEEVLQEMESHDLRHLYLYEEGMAISPTRDSVESRYNELIQQYKQNRQSKNHVKRDSQSFNTFRSANTMSQIIARTTGTAKDCITLLPTPRLSKAAFKKKLKPKRKRKPSTKKAKTLTVLPEPKPTVTGIELMSRKLDLNLNSIKKESADVFDFDDDSPTESVAPKLLSISTSTPVSIEPVQQHQESHASVSITAVISSSVLPNSFKETALCGIQSTPAMTVTANPVTAHLKSHPLSGMHQNNKKQKVNTPSNHALCSEPPACFFSLIRDIFQVHAKEYDYKLTIHRLEELVKDKMQTLPPSLGWNVEHLQSAMNYLSYATERQNSNCNSVTSDSKGSSPCSQESNDSNHIPLVDYKEKQQQWQWIGVCRDSDEVLVRMCKVWSLEKEKHASVADSTQPVPPSICPTDWVVKPSTIEERRSYQEQESIRYSNPNKSFTYKLHNYSSVVGPVKGCGTTHTGSVNYPPGATLQTSPTKHREHSLLVSDRPQFVTVLSLVRDAAARLPNGEGTRCDIVQLLKDSQYLLPRVSDQQINQVVSGALDRLHYEKDPCVKYDTNRKLWIYLHRNRTEQDFERLYERTMTAAKAKKTLTSRKPTGKVIPSVKTQPSSSQGPKPLAAKKLIEVVPAIPVLKPLTCSTQTRISVSPLLGQVCISPGNQELPSLSSVTTTTDKNILNILSKVNYQMNAKQQQMPNAKQPKKKPEPPIIPKVKVTPTVVTLPIRVDEHQTKNHNIIPIKCAATIQQQSRAVRPNIVNRTVHRQPILSGRQVVNSVAAPSVNNTRQVLNNSASNSRTIRPIQPQGSQDLNAGQQTHTISVPNSVLLNRGGQLVFTNGGKQYMMTPATSGGQQYIAVQAHPGNGNPNLNTVTPIMSTGQQQIRGQVIKILSVPSNGGNCNSTNGSRLVLPNQHGQFVARIISRPAGINASGSTTNQIMIPSNPTALQNAIFTQSSQPALNEAHPSTSRMQPARPQELNNQQQMNQVTTVPIQITSPPNTCIKNPSPQVSVVSQDTT